MVSRLMCKILRHEFKFLFDQQKQSNPEIQIASVRNAVWNSMKRELVFQKEYEASGVSVSNEELFDMIQGPDPYPSIQQSFTNPETGAFDRARLLQYLKEDIDNDPTDKRVRNGFVLKKPFTTSD